MGPRAVAGLAPGDAWSRTASCRELTADADPGPAPVGPVRGWLHEPDPALIRSGLMSLVADGATLIDPTIAYLTSDGPADSPWLQLLPGRRGRCRSTSRS